METEFIAPVRTERGCAFFGLMIVVAIVGILAVLAIYGVRKYLANAKTAEARNSIGQIAKDAATQRSEERRGGKECRCRWSADHSNKQRRAAEHCVTIGGLHKQ